MSEDILIDAVNETLEMWDYKPVDCQEDFITNLRKLELPIKMYPHIFVDLLNRSTFDNDESRKALIEMDSTMDEIEDNDYELWTSDIVQLVINNALGNTTPQTGIINSDWEGEEDDFDSIEFHKEETGVIFKRWFGDKAAFILKSSVNKIDFIENLRKLELPVELTFTQFLELVKNSSFNTDESRHALIIMNEVEENLDDEECEKWDAKRINNLIDEVNGVEIEEEEKSYVNPIHNELLNIFDEIYFRRGE